MYNNDAIGHSWDEVRAELFTPQEIAESNARVAGTAELFKSRRVKAAGQRKFGGVGRLRRSQS